MGLKCNLEAGANDLIEVSTHHGYVNISIYQGVGIDSSTSYEGNFTMLTKAECTKLLEVIRMVSGCDLPASWGLNGSSLLEMSYGKNN